MIETGLLWYDDDSGRPVAVKIAEAAQRYRERVGLEPTTCQLNPAQAPAPAAEQPRRKRKEAQAALSIGLRLVPTATLRPNYFFVGIEEGEPVKRVRGWRADDEEGRSAVMPRRPSAAQRTQRATTPLAAHDKPAKRTPSQPATDERTSKARRATRSTPAAASERVAAPAAIAATAVPELPASTAPAGKVDGAPTAQPARKPKATTSTAAVQPATAAARRAKSMPKVAPTVVPASTAAHKKKVAAAQAPHTTTGARVAASKGEVAAAKKTVKRASQGEVARAHKASNTNGAAATLARPAAPATGVATPRTRATPAPAAAAPKKTSRAAAVAAPVPAPARARKAARTTPAAVASTGGRSAKAVVPSAHTGEQIQSCVACRCRGSDVAMGRACRLWRAHRTHARLRLARHFGWLPRRARRAGRRQQRQCALRPRLWRTAAYGTRPGG